MCRFVERRVAASSRMSLDEGMFVGGLGTQFAFHSDNENMKRDIEWFAAFQWKGFKCWADWKMSSGFEYSGTVSADPPE